MNRKTTLATLTLFSLVYTLFAYSEREVVASCLYLEARGEGRTGLLAVASVIQNRAQADNLTAYQVITKPKQFSCFNRGIVIKYDRECLEIATQIDAGEIKDITGGAYFYQRNECAVRPWHGRKTMTYKNHSFYLRKN